MEINQILQSLGLDEKESELYLQLLPIGTSTASSLANKVHIPRSTSQYKCQQLVQKGLFKVIERNGTFNFSVEPPEKLNLLLDQQKQSILIKENRLSLIIGDLKKLYNPQADLQKINYFEGVDGLIEMFEDILKDQEIIYGLTKNDQHMDPQVDQYLSDVYIPRRKQLRNQSWIIFNDNENTRSYQKYDQEVNRISLLIPDEQFPFDACCHIYGQKVAFYSYRKHDLTGVIINNQHIRQSQYSLFKLAWNFTRMLPVNKQYQKISLPQ